MKKFVLTLITIGTFGLLVQPIWADEDLNAILKAFSQKTEVIVAMKGFSDAFDKVQTENSLKSIDELKKDIFSYYDGDFAQEYKNSVGKDPDLTIAKSIDDSAIVLQYYYIFKNTATTGKKNHFTDAKDKSSWTKIHVKHHETLEKFAHDENGFYDLFFVDISGRVVYSVFKEALLHKS